MERIDFFIQTIEHVIEEYLKDLQQPTNAHLTFTPVMDKERLHFQIIVLGWEQHRRVFNLLFHLDIVEDKIWVQTDKMEYSIAERLVEKGINKKEIVLAYFPQHHRMHMEYAV